MLGVARSPPSPPGPLSRQRARGSSALARKHALCVRKVLRRLGLRAHHPHPPAPSPASGRGGERIINSIAPASGRGGETTNRVRGARAAGEGGKCAGLGRQRCHWGWHSEPEVARLADRIKSIVDIDHLTSMFLAVRIMVAPTVTLRQPRLQPAMKSCPASTLSLPVDFSISRNVSFSQSADPKAEPFDLGYWISI